jgi:hypothetical protein
MILAEFIDKEGKPTGNRLVTKEYADRQEAIFKQAADKAAKERKKAIKEGKI